MFGTTTHLQLTSQVQGLLDLIYPKEVAAQDKEIYQFRSHVLAQLNQAQLDPEVLISLIKQLQLIANELDPNIDCITPSQVPASLKTLCNNTMQEGAKIESQVTYNYGSTYYYQTPAQAPSFPAQDRIQDLGSTPSLLPDFIGRTTTIKAIKTAIDNSIKKLEIEAIKKRQDPSIRTENVSIFVISGTNGVGKTSLARELFEDLHPQYNLAAWIDASPERIYHDFCILGEKLHVDLKGTPERIIADIHQALVKRSPTLLLFDGADDQDAIHKYFPQNIFFASSPSQYCHCLITSIRSDSSNKNSFDLDVFNNEEAKQYVNARLKKIKANLGIETLYDVEKQEEENDIEELIKQLAAFPLALAQAMPYIERKGNCSIKQYLRDLENNKATTLSNRLPNTENYMKTVMTTWEIAMRLVNQQNHLAEKVLKVCAYLYSSKISKDFLCNILEKYEILEKLHKNKTDSVGEVLHLLCQYSLIKKLDSRKNGNLNPSYTFRIHTLLQDVIRVKIVHTDDNSWNWRNALAFPHANQRCLLRSINEAIDEIFYKSPIKQDKLEIAFHWEVIMVYIDKLKNYYILFPFTSIWSFFCIEKYGEQWYIPVIGLGIPMFISTLLTILNSDNKFTDFFMGIFIILSFVFSLMFNAKIAISLSEHSAVQGFFREKFYNINNSNLIIHLLAVLYASIIIIGIFTINSDSMTFDLGFKCVIYMGLTIFAWIAIFNLIREMSLPVECEKACDFATLFFDDAQFKKAEKISKFGLNLLKSCTKAYPELEARFYTILGDIYYYQLKNVEACDYYKKALKILENSKKNDLSSFIDKIKKIQTQLKDVYENSGERNNQPINNMDMLDNGNNIRESETTTTRRLNFPFFTHKPSTNTDDLQRRPLIDKKNLQEPYQEISKLKIN